MIRVENNSILWAAHGETILLEPWGPDAIRVRARLGYHVLDLPGALLPPAPSEASASVRDGVGILRNGRITVQVETSGSWRRDRAQITFYNQRGEIILQEMTDPDPRYLHPHRYQTIGGEDFRLSCSFMSRENEKFYGMGQYQQQVLNLKGCVLELCQQNTQSSVPFVYSSLGYGFLWNNPAVGQAIFAHNRTIWTSDSTRQLDYWVTAGDTPAQVHQRYMQATGLPPMMPEYALGLWQSKARYWNQAQVLEVARGYHQRGIPVGVMVVDYFHWPYLGDFRFDEEFFPDPSAMVEELRSMGMETMVSVWTPVDFRSENFQEMQEENLLVRVDHGMDITTHFVDSYAINADVTNPDTRRYVWDKLRTNYLDKHGIHLFWLDEAEPTYTRCDYETYRYALGPAQQVGNLYPNCYTQMIHDGMLEAGHSDVVSLVRCAWAGAQRYGALCWSGDISSTWEAFRSQVCAGQHMAMAGIVWWTTDIGGFKDGNTEDPDFRELLVRWMQWGVFCPVMRLHGCREPQHSPISKDGRALLNEGAPNELWSYGPEVEALLTECVFLRERIRDYVRELMQDAHQNGSPLIRPMFYDFPEDPMAWDLPEQHMFGPDVLVAPVMYPGQRSREVYLPQGADWVDLRTGQRFEGGQHIMADAPLNSMPVFLKNGAHSEWIK